MGEPKLFNVIGEGDTLLSVDVSLNGDEIQVVRCYPGPPEVDRAMEALETALAAARTEVERLHRLAATRWDTITRQADALAELQEVVAARRLRDELDRP